MLVLSRKVGESVIIGGRISVTVVRVEGETVRLGIAAPADVPVHRQEVYEAIQRENAKANEDGRAPRRPAGKEKPCSKGSAGEG